MAACLQLGELRSRITSFTARWHELKPKGVPSGDPALVLVKLSEYSRQLTELQVRPCLILESFWPSRTAHMPCERTWRC